MVSRLDEAIVKRFSLREEDYLDDADADDAVQVGLVHNSIDSIVIKNHDVIAKATKMRKLNIFKRFNVDVCL